MLKSRSASWLKKMGGVEQEESLLNGRDMMLVSRLRRDQGVIASGWEDALKYADPAIKGVLGIYKKRGMPAPVIGYEMVNLESEVICEVEAAWPTKKTAIYIRDTGVEKLSGWNLYSLTEAIQDPENIII